jgi:hypothetical protein
VRIKAPSPNKSKLIFTKKPRDKEQLTKRAKNIVMFSQNPKILTAFLASANPQEIFESLSCAKLMYRRSSKELQELESKRKNILKVVDDWESLSLGEQQDIFRQMDNDIRIAKQKNSELNRLIVNISWARSHPASHQ